MRVTWCVRPQMAALVVSTMGEVFEISDFTTIGALETFAAHFEEVLRDSDWTEGVVRMSSHVLSVRHHEGTESERDFRPRSHCLERWFGEKRFLVIRAQNDASIASEDRALLLLSGVTMALASTARALPVFVQLSPSKRNAFFGVKLENGFRVDYHVIHANHVTKPFRNLSALLTVFRRKVNSNSIPIRLSIRITYSVTKWPPEWQEDNNEPLLELQMAALWPEVCEEVVIDSDIHSDLIPDSAPLWTLRALFRDVDGPLTRSLRAMALLAQNPREMTSSMDSALNLIESWVFDEKHEMEAQEWPDMKSAPMNSLAARIATNFLNILSKEKSEEVLSAFWREMCAKLRHYWESARPLPHVTCSPDLKRCLLHQKLQFLQKCILARVEEQNDEFFDCCDDTTTAETSEETTTQCRALYLLRNPKKALLVPKTQDTPPVTEDMVAEQMALLQRLAAEGDGARVRARLQSQSLCSDMSAFKAANGCDVTFEDFIRWHSPRDFDETTCSLSERFRTEDNVWRELWETSAATPVERQKPLFDFTRDAEKVFHWLDARSTSEAVELLEPLVVMTTVNRLGAEESRALIAKYESAGMEAFIFELSRAETTILRVKALERKLVTCGNGVSGGMARKLVSEPEMEFSSLSAEAEVVRALFRHCERHQYEEETTVGERSDRRDFWPKATAKEFIVRAAAKAPHQWSRDSPQRMYCLLSEKEMRICGAFSTDITYC